MVPLPELAVIDCTHVNFEALVRDEFDRLILSCPEWATTIPDLSTTLSTKFSTQSHGDFAQWRDAIMQVDDAGRREDALRRLMPWRKGPWHFDRIHIDTEWRSDWKWQRLKPHLPTLHHKKVFDVGCGNGYFGWQLLASGADAVIGVDPTLLYCMQHLAAIRLLGAANHWVLPMTLEESPPEPCFDVVLSMGVIYHRKNPEDHVARLFACCRPGATIVIESLIVEGETPLSPKGRYARMRNVSVIPTVNNLLTWLEQSGFEAPRCVDITPTRTDEQRTTSWMPFESLREALDPDDSSKTVEGHPAPVRAIVLATKPR